MAPGIDSFSGLYPGIALNSWQFLLIAVIAVVFMRLAGGLRVRSWLLAAINVYFVSFFLYGPYPLAVLVGLICLTYAIGEIKARFERSLPAWIFTVIVLVMWIALFLIKDPRLLGNLNPFQ